MSYNRKHINENQEKNDAMIQRKISFLKYGGIPEHFDESTKIESF